MTDAELVIDRLTWNRDDVIALVPFQDSTKLAEMPRWVASGYPSSVFESRKARGEPTIKRPFISKDGVLFVPDEKDQPR